MNISYKKLAFWFVYGKLKSDLDIFLIFLKGKGVKKLMSDQEKFQKIKEILEAKGLNVIWNRYVRYGSFLAYVKFYLLPVPGGVNSETGHNFFDFAIAKKVAEKISKKYGVEIIADFIFESSSLLVFKVDITNTDMEDMENVARALQSANNLATKALEALAKKAVEDAIGINAVTIGK